MKNDEARFLLTAYRPDGRDAGDPMFAEPLAQAERDPVLREWLERQQKFDTAVSNKMGELAPPPGLREAILAGARASQPHRRWWLNPLWHAATAAALVLAAIVAWRVDRSGGIAPAEFAALALRDLASAHDDHEGWPPGLSNVQSQLASAPLPLTSHVALDLDELRSRNCRAVRIAGHEVFEICFRRDGAWFHLYIAPRAGFAPGAVDPRALLKSQGELASTAWADSSRIYALVTDAGAEALRRVL